MTGPVKTEGLMAALNANETLTLCIAAYAAIVATVVLMWDIYKWWNAGAKLELETKSKDPITDPVLFERDWNAITVIVINNGGMATTINELVFHHYKSWVKGVFKLGTPTVIPVPFPAVDSNDRLPFVLEPGGQWLGYADYQNGAYQLLAEGRLYAVVRHTGKGRQDRKRVV